MINSNRLFQLYCCHCEEYACQSQQTTNVCRSLKYRPVMTKSDLLLLWHYCCIRLQRNKSEANCKLICMSLVSPSANFIAVGGGMCWTWGCGVASTGKHSRCPTVHNCTSSFENPTTRTTTFCCPLASCNKKSNHSLRNQMEMILPYSLLVLLILHIPSWRNLYHKAFHWSVRFESVKYKTKIGCNLQTKQNMFLLHPNRERWLSNWAMVSLWTCPAPIQQLVSPEQQLRFSFRNLSVVVDTSLSMFLMFYPLYLVCLSIDLVCMSIFVNDDRMWTEWGWLWGD